MTPHIRVARPLDNGGHELPRKTATSETRLKRLCEPLSLLSAHSDTEERALWAATLALEEADVIGREVASHAPNVGEKLKAQSKQKRGQAEAVRAILKQLRPFTVD